MSRKVFCGASNPFMTGMASGLGFEARPWGAFSAAGREGERCRRGRGAPCARLPPPLLSAPPPPPPLPLCSEPRSSRLSLAPPRSPHLPTGQVLSPGLGPRPPRGPHGEGPPATPSPFSAALLPEGSGPRVSLPERIRDTPTWSRDPRGGAGLAWQTRPLPGWPRPHAWFPGDSLWLRPAGFPAHRPRRDWRLVHSAACWSWDISQHPSFLSSSMGQQGLKRLVLPVGDRQEGWEFNF